MLSYNQLNPEQLAAIDTWWDANDPDGRTYDSVDNNRYAVVGNREQEDSYDDQQRGGCCGFVDVELNCGDGTTLLFGFNHGH